MRGGGAKVSTHVVWVGLDVTYIRAWPRLQHHRLAGGQVGLVLKAPHPDRVVCPPSAAAPGPPQARPSSPSPAPFGRAQTWSSPSHSRATSQARIWPAACPAPAWICMPARRRRRGAAAAAPAHSRPPARPPADTVALHKKHGPLFFWRFLGRPVLMVGGYAAAMQVLKGEHTIGACGRRCGGWQRWHTAPAAARTHRPTPGCLQWRATTRPACVRCWASGVSPTWRARSICASSERLPGWQGGPPTPTHPCLLPLLRACAPGSEPAAAQPAPSRLPPRRRLAQAAFTPKAVRGYLPRMQVPACSHPLAAAAPVPTGPATARHVGGRPCLALCHHLCLHPPCSAGVGRGCGAPVGGRGRHPRL